MTVKRKGITKNLRRIWLFSANKIKSPESFRKQPTQLIVELNSSLRHIIVTFHLSFKIFDEPLAVKKTCMKGEKSVLSKIIIIYYLKFFVLFCKSKYLPTIQNEGSYFFMLLLNRKEKLSNKICSNL